MIWTISRGMGVLPLRMTPGARTKCWSTPFRNHAPVIQVQIPTAAGSSSSYIQNPAPERWRRASSPNSKLARHSRNETPDGKMRLIREGIGLIQIRVQFGQVEHRLPRRHCQ